MLKLLEPASMHARLKMWRFRVDWAEERAIQEDSVQVQTQLYSTIKTNKYIHKILSMALAIGNILNGDSPKGQADGFDMSVLDKLNSIKDNSGQSLLSFITKKLIKENPEFPDEIKKLIQLFSTKKTDISVTKGKAGEL